MTEAKKCDLLAKHSDGAKRPARHEPSFIRAVHPPRIEIRATSGESHSFPYAALEYIGFNRSKGIALALRDRIFWLTGVNLAPLFRALHEQAVQTIIVIENSMAPDPPNAVVVDELRVDGRSPGEPVNVE